jgi:hypothetical protein
MEMFLWVYNPMSRRSKSGSVFVYMANMATFNEDFEKTQESMELSQDQDAWKLNRKGPRKEEMQRAIVESLHLSTMATSYNTHFATYYNVKKVGHTIDFNDYLEGSL